MSKLTNIAEGWYNYLVGAAYTRKLMRSRLAICDDCPSKAQVSKLGQVLAKGLNLEDSTYMCKKCSCPLGAKTAATKETCPLGKWGIAGTENFY